MLFARLFSSHFECHTITTQIERCPRAITKNGYLPFLFGFTRKLWSTVMYIIKIDPTKKFSRKTLTTCDNSVNTQKLHRIWQKICAVIFFWDMWQQEVIAIFFSDQMIRNDWCCVSPQHKHFPNVFVLKWSKVDYFSLLLLSGWFSLCFIYIYVQHASADILGKFNLILSANVYLVFEFVLARVRKHTQII